jgi:hypothetical protein
MRGQKSGSTVGAQPARVFDQRYPAILVAHDQVEIAVAVRIERHRHDHLQVHHQRRTVVERQPATGRVSRLGSRAGILEIGEAVQEFAAQQIQIAVSVKVGEVRRGTTADLHILPATTYPLRGPKDRQRIFRRLSARILKQVQSIIGLVGTVHDEIQMAIATEV